MRLSMIKDPNRPKIYDISCVREEFLRGQLVPWDGLTAVMVSIHRTKGSEVRYLESE